MNRNLPQFLNFRFLGLSTLLIILALLGGKFLAHKKSSAPPEVANFTQNKESSASSSSLETFKPSLVTAQISPHLSSPLIPVSLKEQKKKSLVQTHYAKAPIVFQITTALEKKGQFKRVTVVETHLKHPLVRIVDTIITDPETREEIITTSLAMAATHVLVEPPKGFQVATLLEDSNFSILKQFSFSPNVLVSFPENFDHAEFEKMLARVSAEIGEGATVEPDFLVYSSTEPNDPSFQNGSQWSLNNFGQSGGTAGADISATDAWEIRNDASSVVVGVVDTGIRTTHQDLVDNLWVNSGEIAGNGQDDDGNGVIDDVHGFNAIDDNGDPTDFDGHGTHVSGTVGAQGNNDTGVSGVSWNVQLMGLRFLGAQGGFTSDAIEAIDYGRVAGVDILNNSWGGGGFSTALFNAIQRAEDADILFVVAAGNDSSNNDTNPAYPASYTLDSVVSVASSTRTDALSSFSNFGSNSVDLAAPGSSILSSFVTSNTSYATLSGTSMASPHVAGAAALLRAEFPSESFAEIKARLLDTVDIIPAFSGTSLTGGRLNLLGALQNEAVPNPGSLSFELASLNVVETAGNVAIIINRNVGSSGAVSVNYQTQNQSASAGADFTTTNGTLTWADGDSTERIINVPIIDDNASEGVEDFTVNLTSPSGGATLGNGNTITISILDDEAAVLDGLQFEDTVTEGGLNFVLGSPEPSIDAAPDGTVAWAALIFENNRVAIRVRKYASDTSLIWERTLNSASSPVGGFQPRVASGPNGEIIVAYADIASLSTSGNIQELDIAVASYSSSGNLLWNGVLAGDSATLDLPNDVAVANDGSIYIGGDFNLAGEQESYLAKVSPSNGNLLWLRTEDFDSSLNVDDSISSLAIDSSGTVFAGGSTIDPNTGFVGGLLSYSPSGNLLLSETYPAVEQQRILSTAVNTFDEVYVGLRTFNNTTGAFNARLIKVAPQDGSIIWQRAESVGDALPNFLIEPDPNGFIYFVEAAESLSTDSTWSVGLYNRNGDKVFENALDAIAPLSLSSITASSSNTLHIAGAFNGQAQFGSEFHNSGTTTDTYLTCLSPTAQISPGEFAFESETYSGFESTGEIEVTILRQNGVDGNVSLSLSTSDGSALVGSDYLPINAQTVTFLPGQLSATINITLINDFRTENSEIFNLQMSNPSGGSSINGTNQTSILILNDDFAFEEWLTDFFTDAELQNGSITGSDADPDGDGIDNLFRSTKRNCNSATSAQTVMTSALKFHALLTSRNGSPSKALLKPPPLVETASKPPPLPSPLTETDTSTVSKPAEPILVSAQREDYDHFNSSCLGSTRHPHSFPLLSKPTITSKSKTEPNLRWSRSKGGH